MKKVTLMLISLVIITNVFAQKDTLSSVAYKEKKNPNYFGINAGFTTGVGFSYIFWPKKFGVQVTFLPLFDKESYWVSSGLTFLLNLASHNNTVVFLYQGNHFIFSGNEDLTYNLGIGPGIEVGSDVIKFHFMFGYGIYGIPNNVMSRPTGEIGLFYNF